MPLTRDRYEFVKRNWRSDARKNLKTVRSPFLAVFGEHDVNVDWAESASIYNDVLTASNHLTFAIKTYPDAQHGLLEARYFQTANPGLIEVAKFNLMGEAAFADGFLDYVTEWIVEHSSS